MAPRLLVLGLLALALLPASASAASRPDVERSRHLWATINVCDTATHPDQIGIRGSMPGSRRRREVMYMRFRVQYFSRSESRWRDIGRGADSGFIRVGSARHRVREAGWNFEFGRPPEGSSHVLRGLVSYQWRRGRRVVQRAERRTESGHPGTHGSDPPGYSRGLCEMH